MALVGEAAIAGLYIICGIAHARITGKESQAILHCVVVLLRLGQTEINH